MGAWHREIQQGYWWVNGTRWGGNKALMIILLQEIHIGGMANMAKERHSQCCTFLQAVQGTGRKGRHRPGDPGSQAGAALGSTGIRPPRAMAPGPRASELQSPGTGSSVF